MGLVVVDVKATSLEFAREQGDARGSVDVQPRVGVGGGGAVAVRRAGGADGADRQRVIEETVMQAYRAQSSSKTPPTRSRTGRRS